MSTDPRHSDAHVAAASATDARVQAILDSIRAAGGRATGPRRAVLAALLNGGDHPSAEHLAALVQRTHPDVANSTIYRILEHLEELGVIVHVHLGHGAAIYHLAEHNHVHLVCRSCGDDLTVPNDVARALSRTIEDATGFRADLAHFSITGTCAVCARVESGPRRPV